jgi:hypothetical protein
MNYYLRDGRRFVKTEGLYGMYANTDGTYSKEKQDNSYGIVVIHNFKEVVIAHLEVVPDVMGCIAARYNLPTRLQLLAAYNLKHMFESPTKDFWTKEEVYDGYYNWYLNWYNGHFDYGPKVSRRYVREFTTIKL